MFEFESRPGRPHRPATWRDWFGAVLALTIVVGFLVLTKWVATATSP